MIENEKKGEKPKYVDRIEHLEDMFCFFKKAESIKDIVDGNEIASQFIME